MEEKVPCGHQTMTKTNGFGVSPVSTPAEHLSLWIPLAGSVCKIGLL
ncbi:hypothetical protein ADIAL_2133 [Alkalibacterium sp. AK22]|nr:hypothetical protein ADIAL_2133 [Alkalibacterium sp. AK22]